MSIFKGTFFYKAKLSVKEILYLAYYWLSESTVEVTKNMLGHSCKTIVDFFGFFRQLVVEDIDETKEMIGGPGKIVEIDESKFAKRKYNRGHRVGRDKSWVVGGIDPEKNWFAVVVQDRTKDTLLNIIEAYVHPGSIIHTDCWKAYEGIEDLGGGFEHKTVNHSREFISADGVHTNHIGMLLILFFHLK
jgi:transposase-like protein